MNYGVNRTVTDVHTLYQFIDAYLPFFSKQLIQLRNRVAGDLHDGFGLVFNELFSLNGLLQYFRVTNVVNARKQNGEELHV